MQRSDGLRFTLLKSFKLSTLKMVDICEMGGEVEREAAE